MPRSSRNLAASRGRATPTAKAVTANSHAVNSSHVAGTVRKSRWNHVGTRLTTADSASLAKGAMSVRISSSTGTMAAAPAVRRGPDAGVRGTVGSGNVGAKGVAMPAGMAVACSCTPAADAPRRCTSVSAGIARCGAAPRARAPRTRAPWAAAVPGKIATPRGVCTVIRMTRANAAHTQASCLRGTPDAQTLALPEPPMPTRIAQTPPMPA
mmetsp:Transcript_39944/g.127031  ORF Transcript_39944/g.127031 Transcript_39944/m.127031 type:complete len:211 (-) Transcript_39944:15-647(-)